MRAALVLMTAAVAGCTISTTSTTSTTPTTSSAPTSTTTATPTTSTTATPTTTAARTTSTTAARTTSTTAATTSTTAADRWVEQCGPVVAVTAERVRAALDARGGGVTITATATAVATAPGVAPSADAPVGRLVAARLTGPGIDYGGVVAVWIVQPSGALASLNPLAAAFSTASRLNGWQAWRADWERVAQCV